MSNIEATQKKFSDEVTKYNQLQKEYQKVVSMRQQLDEQLNENKIVKEVSYFNYQAITVH
jgi:PREDICTED: HLA class II region expressed gene KE2-like